MNDEQLNNELAMWANKNPVGAGEDQAIARIVQHARKVSTSNDTTTGIADGRFSRVRWFGGGAVAAGIAIAFVATLMLPPKRADNSQQIIVAASTGTATHAELESFALLHVPTDEEEEVLI